MRALSTQTVIETLLSFNRRYDAIKQSAPPVSRFSMWQYERHLNSASDLLDRSMAARRAYLDLIADAFKASQEIAQLEQEIAHDEQRIQAQFAPPVASPLKSWADNRDVSPYAIACAKASALYESRQSIYDSIDRMLSRRRAIVEKAKPTAGPSLDDPTYMRLVAEYEAAYQIHYDFILKHDFYPWDLKNSESELVRKRAQIRLSRQLLDELKKEISPGGKLDSVSEAARISRLLNRDVLEAVSRIQAAVFGLRELLCFPDDFAFDINALVTDIAVESSHFVRELIHRLNLVTQFDQAFTIAFSIKSSLGAQWSKLIDGEKVLMPIESSLFSHWLLPRVRSLSATYSGRGQSSMSLSLWAPSVAKRSDGRPIQQQRLPFFHLGRTANVLTPREPESAGALSLMNVCPVPFDDASWSIQVASPVTSAEVRDIEVQINCVGIPVGAIELNELWRAP